MSINYGNEPIIINSDGIKPVETKHTNLWGNRAQYYNGLAEQRGNVKVTIVLQAYNRFEKLKYSLECLLKNTPEDLYELFLVDNGSEPEVLELFKTVKHPRLRIFRITKNIGGGFPQSQYQTYICGKYFCSLGEDIYVTKNWLTNLLACFEADDKVGIVVPLASYSSNYQCPPAVEHMSGKTREEVQAFAEKFNISNPKKWRQSVRIVSDIYFIRFALFDLIGKADPAFFHDFTEDDICFRLRRAGYKCYVCEDTYIYHDHNRAIENDPVKYQASLDSGRSIFYEKYGIDAWDDMGWLKSFYFQVGFDLKTKNAVTLTVDPHIGHGIYDLKDQLVLRGGSVSRTFAFSTDARFYLDLTTVADDVKIGEVKDLRSYYRENMFDIITVYEPINSYPNPVKLIQDISVLLKKGGSFFFKLHNIYDLQALLEIFGLSGGINKTSVYGNMTLHQCDKLLIELGFDKKNLAGNLTSLDVGMNNFIDRIFESVYAVANTKFSADSTEMLKCSEFYYNAVKLK